MKKNIFFIVVLLIIIPKVTALSKFRISEKVPNMHIESIRDIGLHNGVPFIIRRDDGQFVYCLERPKDINENGYYTGYTYNNEVFKLTDDMLNRINLLAYYGYQYKDHTDIKWYGVTQFLIWKTLYNNVYFTDKRYGSRIDAYVSEVNEIETLLSEHLKLPSFSNDNFEYSIYKNYELIDSNNVLGNYEIEFTNIETYIKENRLYINTKEEGEYEINFVRKSPINEDYILYWLNDSQPLIKAGRINDIKFKINIKVSSGSITINKLDSENIDRGFATLEGAIYGLYNKDELITTIETNKDGIGYIDKLPLDNYYVKEIKPSIGYKLDENIYEINLTSQNKDIIIESYEEVIKGNLVINKYYGNENNKKLEEGAIFEIYDINNNLKGTFETKNGVINEKLEYGNYYGVQIKGITGYSFVDKINIFIKEEKDYVFDLLNKEEILIVEVPDTKVKNYNKCISIFLILFGLIILIYTTKKTTHLE